MLVIIPTSWYSKCVLDGHFGFVTTEERRIVGKRADSSARESILEAAIQVASRDGLLSMTLDNVAKEAGVSKGGLIYHFASKDDLVRNMIAHFAFQVEQALNARVANDPEPHGRWVRALLEICVLPSVESNGVTSDASGSKLAISGMGKFHASLLAAVAVNPMLLEPLREFGKKMRDRIQTEDSEAMEQLLLWMALDGLFVWQLFGLISMDDPFCQELIGRIRDKSRGHDTRLGSGKTPANQGVSRKKAARKKMLQETKIQGTKIQKPKTKRGVS